MLSHIAYNFLSLTEKKKFFKAEVKKQKQQLLFLPLDTETAESETVFIGRNNEGTDHGIGFELFCSPEKRFRHQGSGMYSNVKAALKPQKQ